MLVAVVAVFRIIYDVSHSHSMLWFHNFISFISPSFWLVGKFLFTKVKSYLQSRDKESLFLFRILRGFVKNRRKSKKNFAFFFSLLTLRAQLFQFCSFCLPPLLFYLYSFHSVVCSSSVSLIPPYNSKFKWDNKKRSIHGNTTNLYFFPHFENLIKLFIGRRTE